MLAIYKKTEIVVDVEPFYLYGRIVAYVGKLYEAVPIGAVVQYIGKFHALWKTLSIERIIGWFEITIDCRITIAYLKHTMSVLTNILGITRIDFSILNVYFEENITNASDSVFFLMAYITT